jgi:hypothetical protein
MPFEQGSNVGRKERRTMRYGYWWIEALLGVALIVAPFVGKFTDQASYTDVVVGVLLVVWALVGYWHMGQMKAQGSHPSHA